MLLYRLPEGRTCVGARTIGHWWNVCYLDERLKCKPRIDQICVQLGAKSESYNKSLLAHLIFR